MKEEPIITEEIVSPHHIRLSYRSPRYRQKLTDYDNFIVTIDIVVYPLGVILVHHEYKQFSPSGKTLLTYEDEAWSYDMAFDLPEITYNWMEDKPFMVFQNGDLLKAFKGIRAARVFIERWKDKNIRGINSSLIP